MTHSISGTLTGVMLDLYYGSSSGMASEIDVVSGGVAAGASKLSPIAVALSGESYGGAGTVSYYGAMGKQ